MKSPNGTKTKITIQGGRKMLNMIQVLKHLQNQKGQGMVEYGLILSFVALAAAGAFTLLGTDLTGFITNVAGKLTPSS
jgi:pilus assembly protein Flp/PilA